MNPCYANPKLWMQAITWFNRHQLSLQWDGWPLLKPKKLLWHTGKLGADRLGERYPNALGGIAEQILVKDGDRVKAGQVSLILLGHRSIGKNANPCKKVNAPKQKQLELKELEFQRYFSLNQDVIKDVRIKVAYEQKILNRFDGLQTKELRRVAIPATTQHSARGGRADT